MAFKETKRKGFNFFRSYYDVFNELPKADQLTFITALLDRQFQGIKPDNLKGMAKFAWISQVNSIDSQVKGYEDKTGINLHPRQGGVIRVENTPGLQVEEKEKEKEKEKVNIEFDLFWGLYDKKVGKEKTLTKFSKLKVCEVKKIMLVLPNYIKSTPEKKFRKDPLTYLNGKHWEDEIEIKKAYIHPSNKRPTF